MTDQPAKRPNILLILTDQMRSTAMGCAGVENVHTPNLDRLAGEGVRFVNAVSNTPACTPARATLLTGKHVLTHGLVQNETSLGFDQRTLAHALNDAGYRCGYVGKWHVDGRGRGAYIPPGPRRAGFDDFWAGTECNHDYFAGYYYDDATAQPVWFDCYEPDGQTDLAADYIARQAGRNDPFCLVVSWSPPHCPYRKAPRKTLDRYPPESIELLPNAVEATVQADETRSNPPPRPADMTPAEHDARKRELLAGYYAHITAMDECVGRLLDALDAADLADDTLVVFTSDHGDMLFSQNRGWKCKPWRESVGIPMLMRWDGRIPAGRTPRGPVSLVDLTPTLLSLAGADAPAGVEGADLSDYVLGDDAAAPESAWINFPCMNALWNVPAWRGVVTATHTYAATREGDWVCYDDVSDPFQMRDLVGDPDAAGVVGELRDLMREWLERTGDDFAPASVIADRYIPAHRWNFLPVPPLEPAILEGQRARRGVVY